MQLVRYFKEKHTVNEHFQHWGVCKRWSFTRCLWRKCWFAGKSIRIIEWYLMRMLSSASLYAHRHTRRESQPIFKYWWVIYFLCNIVYVFSKVTWEMFQVTLGFIRKFYTVWITDQNAVLLECRNTFVEHFYVKPLLYRWRALPQRPWKSYPVPVIII